MQPLPEKLYLARQVREMERIAIEDKGISGIGLMRKAGIAVFEAIQERYGEIGLLANDLMPFIRQLINE